MPHTPFPDLLPVMPEIVLAIGALALLMLGVFRAGWTPRAHAVIAALLILVTGLMVFYGPYRGTTFSGVVIADDFAAYLKVLIAIGAAASLLMAGAFADARRWLSSELTVLVILSTLGMFIMVSAADLIALYLGLELSSLALYVIASIDRDNARSSEAGLKYFVLGSLSSGLLLYGSSLIYGFTGHTGFADIARSVAVNGVGIGFVFGLVFVIAGLAFKASAVPFHMWTPDVYEGAPTPITAFFASAPKIAAIGLFARIVIAAFGPAGHDWQQVVAFIALASMLLGAFAGIGQTNLKRLLAYSSIGHVGFALTGLASGIEVGVSGVLQYMTIYLAMTLGAFAVIMALARGGRPVETIGDLAGLSRSNGGLAFVMAMIMFSLAGVPPLAGFFAKLNVLLPAVEAHLYWLAVIGVLSSVVSAFYYLRIVKVMYFDEGAGGYQAVPVTQRAVLALSGLFAVLFVGFAGPLASGAAAAAHALF